MLCCLAHLPLVYSSSLFPFPLTRFCALWRISPCANINTLHSAICTKVYPLGCTYWLCHLVNLQLGLASQPHCGVIFANMTTTKSIARSWWGVYVTRDTKLNPNWLKSKMGLTGREHEWCLVRSDAEIPVAITPLFPWASFLPILPFFVHPVCP